MRPRLPGEQDASWHLAPLLHQATGLELRFHERAQAGNLERWVLATKELVPILLLLGSKFLGCEFLRSEQRHVVPHLGA